MDGNAEADLHKKFWDVLLEYSNNKTDKNVAKDEWTALSKDANLCDLKGGLSEDLIEHYQIKKLPDPKKNCICTHWIVKNKFIFNMFNRNMLTVGSCCIRRYLSYTTKKLCLECKTPFIPSGRRGRNYCPPCKLNWCSERGYRYRRFNYEYMRQTGRSMRANFRNFGNYSAKLNKGRESEFCGHGTSMSYNPSATLNKNRQSEFYDSVTSKSYDPSATLNKEQQSEFRRCDTSESSNPKATPIKEQKSEFRRCCASESCNPKATPNKKHQTELRGHGLSKSLNNNHLSKNVNLNLIQQVKALTFINKAVLFKYLESQEYIQGTKKIHFGKYSEKPLKDFNDPCYYNWFTENVIKPNDGQRLNDEQLAFYFYVSYIHKKF